MLAMTVAAPAPGVPDAGETVRGKATHYDLAGGLGNCSFPPGSFGDLYVALGDRDYAAAGGCGAHLDVQGPRGSVRVLVVDRCPECGPGHVDLSRAAFSQIADLQAGVVDVTYSTARDARPTDPIAVRLKEGSSQWWFSVLVMNHGTPLASVEVQDQSGRWVALERQPYNFWERADGAGPGPFTLRVTDVHGASAVIDGVALRPEVTQPTGVRLGGTGSAGGSSEAAPEPQPSPTAASRASERSSTPAEDAGRVDRPWAWLWLSGLRVLVNQTYLATGSSNG
ncbi:lipoprotein [Cellulomonas bogoriensis 69B4 = DSM 16987]|uniref:Lipoprotein n=1 Tax=Cellulomonas bogoriensis 69B4 = DSM 16987 TaxID=1386082 RepID=A0A0A0C379_9CELL|nr:lipoprotein [Cellulomonas bogoriensis 69B4 = DSM 16987]